MSDVTDIFRCQCVADLSSEVPRTPTELEVRLERIRRFRSAGWTGAAETEREKFDSESPVTYAELTHLAEVAE